MITYVVELWFLNGSRRTSSFIDLDNAYSYFVNSLFSKEVVQVFIFRHIDDPHTVELLFSSVKYYD